MTTYPRTTGIALVPELPWGTHLCLFYETHRDLLEILIPYVKAGLENSERCVVMTWEHVTADQVMETLRAAMPDMDRHERLQALEVIDNECYFDNGKFSRDKTLRYLREALDDAIGRGFEGLRIVGNEAWLTSENWRAFSDYEHALDAALAGSKMIVLCAYPLAQRAATQILEVARTHEYVIAKRDGGWDVLETAALKQTKAELSRLYRTLFEASQDVIVIDDEADRIVDINPRAAQITGYTLKELRAMSAPRDLVVPEDAARVQEMLHEARNGHVKEYEARWRAKDGRIIDFHVVSVPLVMPGQRSAWTFCSLRDITQRKEVERELRESEKLVQQVLATLPVGVAVTNQAGDIVLTNAASKRIWSDVIVSGAERWARTKGFWHDTGERVASSEWASVRALSTGETSLNELIDIETFDGRRRTIQNSVAPIRNEDGQIVGAVIVNEDVTERVRAENALRRASEELTALSRRLVEVQEAERRELSRELHDRIGQHLTALGINLEIVKARLVTNDEELRSRLEDSRALLEATSDATVDLLSELRPPMLDDLGLLAALEWYARGFSERTGIEVSVVGEEHARRLDGESEIVLFRIMQEALNNVVKHADARHVDVELTVPDGESVLSISDDGVGLDATTDGNPHMAGGFGIVTMRERALAIGAGFDVLPRPGGGTSVIVRVPLNHDQDSNRKGPHARGRKSEPDRPSGERSRRRRARRA